MTLPNFLVIGAGRSGTTSLHHYLGQHPQVFLPSVKSPSHFFCSDLPPIEDPRLRAFTQQTFVPDPRAYEAMFDAVRNERAIGEVSPVYLATVHAAPRIARRLPDVRLIAILRSPVDRAWARFVGRRRDGLELRADFREIMCDELREPLVRDVAFGTYVASGCCHQFLESYFRHFPRERIRIHLFEDFQRDPTAVMADLFEFLGVDSGFVPQVEKLHNRSGGLIRSPVRRWIWTRSALTRAAVGPWLPRSLRDTAFRFFTRNLVQSAMDPALRGELVALFRDDVEKVGDLIGRDVSHWLALSE